VLQPHLIDAEIEPHMTNTSELALAAGGFLDDALAGRLSHADQDAFNDAVAAAVKRDLPGGGFAWTKTRGGSIAQLMAASLAHFALLKFAPTVRPKPKPPIPLASGKSDRDDRFMDLDKVPF
jgi:hypothetical protein